MKKINYLLFLVLLSKSVFSEETDTLTDLKEKEEHVITILPEALKVLSEQPQMDATQKLGDNEFIRLLNTKNKKEVARFFHLHQKISSHIQRDDLREALAEMEQLLRQWNIDDSAVEYLMYYWSQDLGSEYAKISYKHLYSAAKSGLNMAVYEWVNHVLRTKSGQLDALECVRLLNKIQEPSERKQVHMLLIRLTIQFHMQSVTDITTDQAVAWVLENKEHLLQSQDSFILVQAADILLFGEKSDGGAKQQAICILEQYAHRNKNLGIYMNLIYLDKEKNTLKYYNDIKAIINENPPILSFYIQKENWYDKDAGSKINSSSDFTQALIDFCVEEIKKEVKSGKRDENHLFEEGSFPSC